MEQPILFKMMDDFYKVLCQTPVEDMSEQLLRCAGTAPHTVATEALVRILTLEYTRRCHADAKYLALLKAYEAAKDEQEGK